LDYPISLSCLQQCKPTTDAQTKALQLAIAALNAKKSYAEIAVIFSKTAFKTIAPAAVEKSSSN
jgi:hypothetical protein